MKHVKLFEQFVTEGYTGKWKVETWGKMPGPPYRDWETDRKSTRLNSSHITRSRMPSSA